ncbi:exonuclease [Leptothermofonsia sichuanensis E412]|uniref:exonuclease n=1 Tax=Leptothermofonsia sichuanensis TaxID=2917832 RepID=UPI001CA680DF|nr:exonuclease [Leptothermofonsia sichuanensis]QZZ18875.1 exonuclease [Leptothermofonsia sichuanensis E412]
MTSDFSPLPSYRARQIRQRGQQYYVDDRGYRLPSVSTILNATRSLEQRQALARWQQQLGMEAATRISTTASRRGTGTHKQVERYLQGESVVCPDGIRPYWESIKPVLQAVDQVRLVEGTVFHYNLGYAGKADCVASYQGVPCLCEWKTADRPKHSLDHLNDYPLQVVAYWGAVNHCYRDHDVNLDHALLAIAIPNQPAEVFWFEPEALAHYWQQWQERVAVFWRRAGGYGGV